VYLLDTNVLSDLNPDRPGPNQNLVDWLRSNGDRCYLGAVTLTETAYGAAWLRARRANARAARLGAWLEQIIQFHAARILPVDNDVALQAGVLMQPLARPALNRTSATP
jgi:predicted nucleic acid-binding protein